MRESGNNADKLSLGSRAEAYAQADILASEVSKERGYRVGDLVVWKSICYKFVKEKNGQAVIEIPEGNFGIDLDNHVETGTRTVPFAEISHADVRSDMENISHLQI